MSVADPMPEVLIPRLRHLAILSMIGWVVPASGQRLDWRTQVTLYGDNTEFFTPYRTGETIFGGQVMSFFEARSSRHNSIRVGAFADRRFGSDEFVDSIKPVLAFRHQTTHSLGVFGTLDNARRHGLLDPVMVSTREITTPIEYGLQWRERRRAVHAEAWINWQRLNTESQREQFELGAVVAVTPFRWLTVEAQHLWFHRGGQLHDAGVPVSNNRVTGIGLKLHDSLPAFGRATLAGFGLWSDGHIDPSYPADRPGNGHGVWLRGSVEPRGWVEVFVIHWRGRDFAADAGDPNYGSAGFGPTFYRAERRYTEIGAQRRSTLRGGVQFDAEVRWHRIDNEDSIAFFGTPWELSYRLLVRVPVDVRIR